MSTVLELLSNMPGQANFILQWQAIISKMPAKDLMIYGFLLPLSYLYPNDSSTVLFAVDTWEVLYKRPHFEID